MSNEAMERVSKVYPDAKIGRDHHSAYYAFTKKGAGGRISGYMGSEDLEWADAASKLPATVQPEDENTKGSGFICGAWTIREQGPILNYEQPYIRAKYVYRCDCEAGHEGDHVDSVLLTNWSGPTPEDAAKAKLPTSEDETTLPAMDVTEEDRKEAHRVNIAPLKSGEEDRLWTAMEIALQRKLRTVIAERDALKAERDKLLTESIEDFNNAEDQLSTLKSQLDAVVGQETAESAWDRAQLVMAEELAKKMGLKLPPDEVREMQDSNRIPYTPPLKAGQK